ncbi:hypothetical protein M5K25_023782 [Dendrobium thyrsiflorum]|uniref:Uncharacterized protein n=1 Tax=Dendrobium thyrsiflorum TaxID=117978 RepID=A0ABD0U0N3_DENTH
MSFTGTATALAVTAGNSSPPNWMVAPELPVLITIHLINYHIPFVVALIFRHLLQIDHATTSLSCPAIPRMLVELEVLTKLPKKVWPGYEKYRWFVKDPYQTKFAENASNNDLGANFSLQEHAANSTNKELEKDVPSKEVNAPLLEESPNPAASLIY